jgi:hypothetical protein
MVPRCSVRSYLFCFCLRGAFCLRMALEIVRLELQLLPHGEFDQKGHTGTFNAPKL